MHNQLYRPTEAEASHGAKPHVQVLSGAQHPSGEAARPDKFKVVERVDKVEKGVGRFLKKLDGKW
jgi:hypothetical protein